MIDEILERDLKLQKLFYTIEKAILDFRISEVEAASATSIAEKPDSLAPSNDNAIEQLKEQIKLMQEDIANIKNRFCQDDRDTELPADDEEEPALVVETKPKRQYKERGGSVFKDFKSLNLENSNFEGNSVYYKNESKAKKQ